MSDKRITHEEARAAAKRFIDRSFNAPNRERVHISIPAKESDDDVLLTMYIAQQKDAERDSQAAVAAALEKAAKLIESPMTLSTPHDEGVVTVTLGAVAFVVATNIRALITVPQAAALAEVKRKAEQCGYAKGNADTVEGLQDVLRQAEARGRLEEHVFWCRFPEDKCERHAQLKRECGK